MRIPCNPGPHHWAGPHGGCFRPAGPIHKIDDGALAGFLDGYAWSSRSTLSARIIVGFSVGDTPTWDIDDLIPIVQEIRLAQGAAPNASFLAQRGIYQHRDPRKGIVVEDGAQILIINMEDLSEAEFEQQMADLAADLAEQLKQEEVILEIQRNGVTLQTHGIVPD
jgi:hypothetical protein